ncbi:MAG: tetratricopeptide repeat protein [Methylococcaceae bacterium]|nr:tetratricopeptide repeat protein [Methylococcaceae bacterium]
MKTLFLILMTQLLLASNLALAEDSVTATQALATMDIQAMSNNGKLEMTPITRPKEDIKLDQRFQSAIVDGLSYIKSEDQASSAINEIFDPILKYFDDKYRRSDFKIFSAHSSEAALMYAMKGAREHEKVLVISKTWAEANYAKGFALFELGQLGEAKYYLTKALALSPFNATYLFELGQVLLREKNWQQA